MPEELEIRIAPDGKMGSMYSDPLLKIVDKTDKLKVTRASLVEWDPRYEGWTVIVPGGMPGKKMALRTSAMTNEVFPGMNGLLAVFDTREEALKEERKFFWELLEK